MFERLSFLRRLQLTIAIAAIVFVLVLGALALRTALGKDPALGASATPIVQSTSASIAAGTSTGDASTDDSASTNESWPADTATDDGSWDDGSSSSTSSVAAQAPMTTSQS